MTREVVRETIEDMLGDQLEVSATTTGVASRTPLSVEQTRSALHELYHDNLDLINIWIEEMSDDEMTWRIASMSQADVTLRLTFGEVTERFDTGNYGNTLIASSRLLSHWVEVRSAAQIGAAVGQSAPSKNRDIKVTRPDGDESLWKFEDERQ